MPKQMCSHGFKNPIVEIGDNGDLLVLRTVCTICLQEFAISPMTLLQYRKMEFDEQRRN